jgi:hypothetical protein
VRRAPGSAAAEAHPAKPLLSLAAQFLYCGKKAVLAIGNTMPIGEMPEGTIICNVEEKAGDRGALARASGDYAIVVAHNPDSGITRIKLPSGSKKVRRTQRGGPCRPVQARAGPAAAQGCAGMPQGDGLRREQRAANRRAEQAEAAVRPGGGAHRAGVPAAATARQRTARNAIQGIPPAAISTVKPGRPLPAQRSKRGCAASTAQPQRPEAALAPPCPLLSPLHAAQVVPSSCRATVGQVAGGGRTEKPMLKAGRAYHKYRVKRNSWPKVRSGPLTWGRGRQLERGRAAGRCGCGRARACASAAGAAPAGCCGQAAAPGCAAAWRCASRAPFRAWAAALGPMEVQPSQGPPPSCSGGRRGSRELAAAAALLRWAPPAPARAWLPPPLPYNAHAHTLAPHPPNPPPRRCAVWP